MNHDPNTAAKPAYISRCSACNGMTGCCADEPRHANDVAKFIRDAVTCGEIIEHKTAADVWAATWCDCGKLQEQPTLFATEV